MAHEIDRIYMPELNVYPWTVEAEADNEEAAGAAFRHRCGEVIVLDSGEGEQPLLEVLGRLTRHARQCEAVGPDLQNIYRGTATTPERAP